MEHQNVESTRPSISVIDPQASRSLDTTDSTPHSGPTSMNTSAVFKNSNDDLLYPARRGSIETIEVSKKLSRQNSARSSLSHTLRTLNEPVDLSTLGLVNTEPSRRHERNSARISWASRLSAHRLSLRSSRSRHQDSQIITTLPSLDLSNALGLGDEKDEINAADIEKQGSESSQSSPTTTPTDPNLVVWDGPNDPGNPMNWSRPKKWACTIVLAFMTFCVTFASSVFSAAIEPAARYFHTSPEVMVLGTAILVLGFAFGPIVWGPLSELYGRKPPLVVGLTIFAIFQVPAALATNLATLLASRFLAGLFGSAPLTIVGGALADFWNPVDRGIAVAIYSGATFLGPTMGPIVGGFLTENEKLGWRWTSWITLILTVFWGAIGFVVYPESFAPVLLQRRAKMRRVETGNQALRAAHEETGLDMRQIVERYLARPLVMLVKEPILMLITIYMSFIYGILYLFFEVYPVSFQFQRGWSVGIGSLPFIAVMCGVLCGATIIYFFTKTRFARIYKERGRVPPEERLLPMIIGGGFLPIGLFWYGWTSSPDITPWPQIIAGAPVGMGILLIFLQGTNYIIDVYLMNSASAIAGNSFVRSWLGAGFPMFAGAMYRNLGVAWATSLLGFLAVALFPVPILFYIFGARIRQLSRYSPQLPPGAAPGPSK